MKLKETFNSNSELYNELRPTYTNALYEKLFSYKTIDENSNLLEIGIGTGQATKPFLDKECSVTAIELGENLAKLAADKFKMYNKFKVVNSDFESVELVEKFDLLYSASAFHWIDPEVGLPKVYELLNENGVFAWISTTPCPWKDNEDLFEELQEVYGQYAKYFGSKTKLTLAKVDEGIRSNIQYKEELLRKHNFTSIDSSTFEKTKEFTSNDYIRLLETYSDHTVIPTEDKESLYHQIKEVIDRNGGKVRVTYTNVLVLGKKI